MRDDDDVEAHIPEHINRTFPTRDTAQSANVCISKIHVRTNMITTRFFLVFKGVSDSVLRKFGNFSFGTNVDNCHRKYTPLQ